MFGWSRPCQIRPSRFMRCEAERDEFHSQSRPRAVSGQEISVSTFKTRSRLGSSPVLSRRIFTAT